VQKGRKAHSSASSKRAEALRGAAGWPEFADDHIRSIPGAANYLPAILREWARVDLREHFARESPAAQRVRRERLSRLGKIADRLVGALDELDKHDRGTLAGQIGAAEGQEIMEALFDEKTMKGCMMFEIPPQSLRRPPNGRCGIRVGDDPATFPRTS
jgi:hypothetical protein